MTTLSNWEEESKLPLRTSCKQAAQLVNLSLERRLTIREFVTMKIHLWTCKTCTFYKRQVNALRKIFTRNEEALENIPPSEDEKLSECSKTKMQELIEKNR
jgi:hypothetical protein